MADIDGNQGAPVADFASPPGDFVDHPDYPNVQNLTTTSAHIVKTSSNNNVTVDTGPPDPP